MKSFRQFNEEKEKEVFFTFGRFNPPTTGHQKLMDKIAKVARGKDYKIYASNSVDPKKNPLSYKDKIRFMRKMFPKHARSIMMSPKIKTAINIAVELHDMGYNKLTMVVGGDRIKEFESLLKKYNGVKARHGYYEFNSIDVVSAGERDPDATDVTGMSASKMRAAVADGDFKSFQGGLPKGYSGGAELFNALRKAMGFKKITDFREHVQLDKVSDIREQYARGEIFNIGDKVYNKDNKIVTISERKPNYIVSAIGKKYWIDDLSEVRQDKDVKDKKGTQPAKYYAKDAKGKEMSKSTKSKRDAHFKKGAAKDDDDPSAYKPAPGDKSAKTKPSKHTKKFKQMFGESDSKPTKVISKGSFAPREYQYNVFPSRQAAEKKLKKAGFDGMADISINKNTIKVKPGSRQFRKAGIKATDYKAQHEYIMNIIEEKNPRIPRKKGQPANSKKHSDLYTDENPKGTIKGLGFKDVETAEASVKKIENSGKTHAHKIQAAIAMEQRARVMKKTGPAAVYRRYINKMKKKTKERNESLDEAMKFKNLYHSSNKKISRPSNKPMFFAIDMQHAAGDDFRGWYYNMISSGTAYVYEAKPKGKVAAYDDRKVEKLFEDNKVDLEEYVYDLVANPSQSEIQKMEGTKLLEKNKYIGLQYVDYDPRNFAKDLEAVVIFNPAKSTSGFKKIKASNESLKERVKYMNMIQLKKELKKEYGSKASSLKIVKVKGGVSIQTPGGQELERYNNIPKLGYTVAEDKNPIIDTIDKIELDEKLITFAKKAYPKSGHALILAGGAGSGKGFVLDNLIGMEGKKFDVDELKRLVLKAPKIAKKVKDETGQDLSKFNLNKPDDVFKLHNIVADELNLSNKKMAAFFASVMTKRPEDKPNVIFDVTLKDLRKLDNITRLVQGAFYDKKNIHIVWVVNDVEVAKSQNTDPTRGRVVPVEILVNTHRGASQTMLDIVRMGKNLKKYMDGDITFAFNKIGVDSDLAKSGRGGQYIKDALYFKVKESGKPPMKHKDIEKDILRKIDKYVPAGQDWVVESTEFKSFKDYKPFGLRGTDELTKKYKEATPGQDVDEGLWDNIRKKKERIKRGSGEKMRKKGEKGAPTAAQMKRASESIEEGEKKKSETWEKGFERRVVRTTKPEHKAKGYEWRIKGKERNEISIKLYKKKPSFAEFKKQMRRVAGHEFGG